MVTSKENIMTLITKLRHADKISHSLIKKGINLTKQGVKAASEKAKEVEQSVQNNERFLSDDTYIKIDKIVQTTKQKAKEFWEKLTS